MKKYSLIIVVFCSLDRGAFAGKFEPAQVPANSQWYLHFDVDGFKKGPFGKFALEQASKEAGGIDALAKMSEMTATAFEDRDKHIQALREKVEALESKMKSDD